MQAVVKSKNKRKRKKALGETPKVQQGIMVTPERIVLYALGIVAIGGTFWIAKKYVDSLVQKTEKDDTTQEPIVIKLEQGNAGGASVVSQPQVPQQPQQPAEQPTQPQQQQQDVVIPPITEDRYWGGVTAQRDEFPLRKGQGGLRVKALQQAYRKLGYGINNATGYFGDVTLRITRERFGKDSISQEDFVRILKQANMKGLEGILDGVEHSITAKLIRG